MIDVGIIAKRVGSVYRLSLDMGDYSASLKWDTGAKYTVISIGALVKGFSTDAIEKLKEYCEVNSKSKEQFISATGHAFWGYQVKTDRAVLGETELNEFYYYLVIENQRDIALLGFDFIDNCRRLAESHGDISITGFDDEKYRLGSDGMNSEDVIAFIESLITE